MSCVVVEPLQRARLQIGAGVLRGEQSIITGSLNSVAWAEET